MGAFGVWVPWAYATVLRVRVVSTIVGRVRVSAGHLYIGRYLMSICANRDWILMVDSHQNFHCAFDRGRYDALADALIAGRAVES